MNKKIVLLTMGLCSVPSAWGGTSNWVGSGSDFNTGSNWSNGVPTDIADFATAAPLSLSASANTTFNSLVFDSGASTYSITLPSLVQMNLNGAGITNNSVNKPIINAVGGILTFNNSATAGNAIIGADVLGVGAINFNDSSSANQATIKSTATLSFNNTSTAGNASITTYLGHDVDFNDQSNAGTAKIKNWVSFLGTSNASSATITQDGTSGFAYFTIFDDNSNAGKANITTNGTNGETIFQGNSSAGGAIITNLNGSKTFFVSTSVATFNATITNCLGCEVGVDTINGLSQSTVTNNGLLLFYGLRTVDTSGTTIINNGGGTLDISDMLSGGGLSVGALSGNGSVNLGANNLVLGNHGLDTTISGAIGGHDGFIVKTGTGTLTLSGTNTYSGGTTVNQGIVRVTSDVNLGISTAPVSFANNGILQTGAGITTARPMVLNTGGGTIDTNGFNSTWSGNITGTGLLTKAGGGTLALSGPNNYTGGTNLTAGTLSISNDNNLGNSISTLTISNNATLQISAGLSGTHAVAWGSGGGIFDTNGFASTWSGNFSGSGSFTKTGLGTLTLSGSNANSGATVVNGGILQAGAVNALSNTSAITLANNAGVALNLNGFNQTIGSLAGGGGLGGNVALGGAALSLGADNTSTTYSGVISGAGSLVKTGNGIFTLSGANAYSGGTTISGGILSVANDGNLGLSAGNLTFSNNGTLQTSAAVASSRSVTLNTGGGTFDTHGFNSLWSGSIGGAGSLTKMGSGVLTLSGANNYLGATIVNSGILQPGAVNVLSNQSGVILANTAGAALNLNGFDESIGSLAGGGTLGGNVVMGTSTLTIGSDNASTDFAGAILGSGDLLKVGNGAQTFSGINGYTGLTTINSGTLAVDGSLAGAVRVAQGGTLAGTGHLGDLTNNGSVTPGANGAGHLSVASYSGPGTLNIQFNGSANNSLSVSGAADITGGVLTIGASNVTTGRYDILTAGSVNGTFAVVNAPLSIFLSFQPEYTATDVLINIGNQGTTFGSVAQSANQKNVAATLDATRSAGDGDFQNAIHSLLLLTSGSGARAAYDQINGDSLASFQRTALRSAEVFTTQMNDRASSESSLTTARLLTPIQLAYAGDISQTALGVSAPQSSSASVVSYGLWSRGLGYFDHVNANAAIGSPSSEANTGGFQVGYDFLVADNVLFGFSGGYAQTSLNVYDRSSSGSASTMQVGLYASCHPGQWIFDGSLAYLTASNDMTRGIQFSGFNEQAGANFTNRVRTVFAEARYDLTPRQNFSLQPSFSLRQSHLQQNGFTETGAPGLNLTVQDQTLNSLVAAVGGRLTRRFGAASSHPYTLGLQAAWQHELADADNRITAQFADAPGNAFTVQATPQTRNAAALGLDGSVDLRKNLEGFANYSATIGTGQNSQGLFGGLRLHW